MWVDLGLAVRSLICLVVLACSHTGQDEQERRKTGKGADSGESESDADADADADSDTDTDTGGAGSKGSLLPEQASALCPDGWSAPVQTDRQVNVSKAEGRAYGRSYISRLGLELAGGNGSMGAAALGQVWAFGCFSGDQLVGELSHGITGDDHTVMEVQSPGDVDGDGIWDWVIAEERSPGNGVYLVLGPASDQILDPTTGMFVEFGTDQSTDGSFTMAETTPWADANGDGHVDLLLGAYDDPTGGSHHEGDPDTGWTTYAGAVYLLNGPLSAAVQHEEAQDAASAIIVGSDPVGSFGGIVAWVPDLDGDGFDEISVLGSVDPEGEGGFSAYLYRGPVTGQVSSLDADMYTNPAGMSGSIGKAMGGADFDGDGLGEWAVGCGYCVGSTAERVGVVYIYDLLDQTVLAPDDARARLESPPGMYALHGEYIATLDDVNGDEKADMLVGSGWGYLYGAGAILTTGPFEGNVDLTEGRWLNDDTDECLVGLPADLGDIDGDNLSDIAIGCPATDTYEKDAGMVLFLTAAQLGY